MIEFFFKLLLSLTRTQILNSDHPCHFLYHTHLINSTVYYEQLLHDLQDHYGIQATKLDAQQLEGTYIATEYLVTSHHFLCLLFF